MISPATGATLTSQTATFTWDSGAGVSQYQILVGSTPGGSDYLSSGMGSAKAATVALPNASSPVSVYATLGSLISGSWQSRSYNYKLDLSTTAGLEPSGSGKLDAPETYFVYNDGKPKRLRYCLRNPFTFQCDNALDAGRLSNCTVGSGVTAELELLGTDSQSGNPYEYDVKITANRSAPTNMDLSLSCDFKSRVNPGTLVDVTLPAAVKVYDATPEITWVYQYPPDSPGGPFYIAIGGQYFGPTGSSLSICRAGADPCAGTPDISIDAIIQEPSFGDRQINALLRPNVNAAGDYEVQIGSSGALGNGFVPNPQEPPKSKSNRGRFTMCDVPTVTITSRPGPSFLNTNFQTYLGAVVSTPGTLVWSSDNAAMISFPDGTIQPMSGAGGSPSLQMQVNGSGKVTITATHTRSCGSSASDSFTYVLSNDVTSVGWVDDRPGIAMIATLQPQVVNAYLPTLLSSTASCGITILNWRDAGNDPNTFVPTNRTVSAAVDRRYVNWWFEATTGNNIPADQIDTALFRAFQVSFASTIDSKRRGNFETEQFKGRRFRSYLKAPHMLASPQNHARDSKSTAFLPSEKPIPLLMQSTA
jgi:hypothetical protein